MLNIEREKDVLEKFWNGKVKLNMQNLTDYGLDDLKKLLGDKGEIAQGDWAICWGEGYQEQGLKASPFDFIGVQRYMISKGCCIINNDLQHWDLFEVNEIDTPVYDLVEDEPDFLAF